LSGDWPESDFSNVSEPGNQRLTHESQTPRNVGNAAAPASGFSQRLRSVWEDAWRRFECGRSRLFEIILREFVW
jgi:hypothetical protein